MNIALIADPHVSLLDKTHVGMPLSRTVTVTEAVIDDLERQQPDLAIWLGDLTHEGTDAVRARFAQMAQRLSVPCLWMIGNHDVEYISKRGFARQTVPCTFRHWMHAAGWDVVILDTVRERSPDNPNGLLQEPDRALLRHVAEGAEGPVLVLAHHPLRSADVDTEAFWEQVADYSGTGVYIGGHSHRDLYAVERGWRVLDVASCCRPPFGYHWVELSPQQITITPVKVAVAGVTAEADEQPDAGPVYPLTIPVEGASTKAAEDVQVAR